MRAAALVLLALLSGCTDAAEPGPESPRESACEDASAGSGELECLHRIRNEQEWEQLSVPSEAVDQVRSAKYLLPARADARLPPLFLNGARHPLHYDFLVEVFPELFPTLTPKDYLRLLFDAEVRELVVGSVTQYRRREGGKRWGFTISGDPAQPGFITCDDVRAVHGELKRRLPDARDLGVAPSDQQQLADFPNCGVPFIDPGDVAYEAYHRAAAFGTVRRFRGPELAFAVEQAEVGFRDLVVVDEAPSDIETVVSAVVTGTRQGPLSHVAVRSAARGTPNCFLEGAYEYFEAWQDQLVRLECGARGLSIRAATLQEAEQYWEQLRPAPVTIPEPDREHLELLTLEDLPLGSAEQRALGAVRFGAKGRNLAWLRQNAAQLTPRGFLIPVAHHLRFLEQSHWRVDLGAGEDTYSFAETLAAWHAEPAFTTDGALRRERLAALQRAMQEASCDAELVTAVGALLVQTFGSAEVTVRFRSSSNAEDGAFFNGAGLYDSYSGCLADDLDDDELGPSRCDPHERQERGVCRALRKVWASLYNPKAYDERAFYGIDPSRAAMGVLVNERSEAELANMVVFSGNPSSARDDRYLVNAQIDELPVVSPAPGVWPEQSLLTLQGGQVSRIERVSGSSELPASAVVLSDEQLKQLGAELARLAERYPHDVEPPAGRSFLLDTEWKVMPDGALRIKQIRPFLR